ncbi:MAG: hypothetical protein IJH05_04975 [Firmicutes bacterium]|nr:hypothetical protein [Bacillota bacterium]
MRFKGTKLSNRTVALFAAAILLLSSGGFMGVKALPNVQGNNYDAALELDEISVQLLENGEPVGEDGLLAGITAAKPGMTYPENISVTNNGTAPEYVRLVVRKYWTKDGKDTDLDPKLIELGLGSGWTENTDEATAEMSVYYLTGQLAVGDTSQAIKSVRVDGKILTEGEQVEKSKVGDKTIYKYTYKYDGYSFNIEAEAQAVQTHNAEQAIKSVWGVDSSVVGL